MNREPMKQKIARYAWNFEGRRLPVGVGCAHVGAKLEDDVALLERAYELGFRYYDTSRTYGESECVVGELLRRIPRDTIFLATKSMYPYRPERDADKAFEFFKRNFYESFERMGVDHIDLYQIHDTNDFTICTDRVLPFLIDRRGEGLIDYIGMGTCSLNALDSAILSGEIDSVLSFMEYSLITRAAESTIALAKERGVAFLNASVLHFGAFKQFEAHGKFWWEREGFAKHVLARAASMKALCEGMGVDVIQASLQYSLFNPDIDMLLNGLHRMSNLDATVAAMRAEIAPEKWRKIAEWQAEDPYIHTQYGNAN